MMKINSKAPIFIVSNKTEEGLPKLKEFLSYVTSRISESGLFKKPEDPVEYYIDDDYHFTGIGIVIDGTLKSGTIKLH